MERRQALRIPHSLPVELMSKDAAAVTAIKGKTGNISQTGAYLTFEVPFQIIGKSLSLKIPLKDQKQPFMADAHIVWQDLHQDKIRGLGLRFTGVPEEEKEKLSLYLSDNEPYYWKEFQKIKSIRHPGFRLNDREKANLDILTALRIGGCISKSSISQLTDLNIVTLTNYLNNFIKKGLVLERGLDTSSGGRRPVLLELNSAYGFVIGLDINVWQGYINALMVDLSSKILHKRKIKLESGNSNHLFADTFIERFILDFLKDVKVERSRIFALAMGVCSLNNNHLEMKRLLEKNIDLPLIIENNYAAALFAEKWLNFAKGDIRNILYFGLEDTISSLSGEDLFLNKGKSSLVNKEEGIAGNVCWLNDNCVFNLQPIKIPFKIEDAQQLIFKLSAKIAYLANIFIPDTIILGGGLEQFSPNLIARLKEEIKRWAFDDVSERLKIIPAQLGEDAVALGAASLAIRDFFTQI